VLVHHDEYATTDEDVGRRWGDGYILSGEMTKWFRIVDEVEVYTLIMSSFSSFRSVYTQ
jgi:hypothetical protein